VLSRLKSWFGGPRRSETSAHSAVPALALPEDCWFADARLPIPDWRAVAALEPEDESARDAFWRSAAVGWLEQLGAALGDEFEVAQSAHFALLAPWPARERQVALDFAERSRRRIRRALDGVASDNGYGPIVIVVFDTIDHYYDYVDHYYPSEGVFAMSGGMFIDAGYGHFVFTAEDLAQMEPVLVHELTHAQLRNLELPRWLDEGAAVNMEKHLLPQMADPRRSLYAPHEMADKHAAFWDAQTIQEFWTGHSFLRPDDGNLLSYDLAERLTQLLGRDFLRYASLLNRADARDGGATALQQAFGLSAGDLIAEVLGPGPWEPQPADWAAVEAQAVSRAQQLAAALPDDADDVDHGEPATAGTHRHDALASS
jgi:hypothetical protein